MDVTRRDWLAGSAMMTGLMAVSTSPAPALPALETVDLWPGQIGPGSANVRLDQKVVERSQDPARPDRYVAGITRPYLTIHHPEKPDGRCLLITPGGGYQRVVVDKEGGELGPLLAAQGVTVFVLTYRLPGEAPQHGPHVALQDAQRAMRLIRYKAKRWGIQSDALTVMGFSAGGHVAATLGTKFDTSTYDPVDAADTMSARPARMALIYPVVSMETETAHPGSRERLLSPNPSPEQVAAYSPDRQVTAGTPPTFLLHAADDPVVPVENSLLFHAALRRAGVPVEMHLYPKGGHGFGHGVRIAPDNPLRHWPRLFSDWWAG